MASNTRTQLETWLRTIDVKGNVADVGGLYLPIKGRTKTWDVVNYDIMDIRDDRDGIRSAFVFDLNLPYFLPPIYDTVFLIEVTNYVWNPVQMMQTVNRMMKPNATLYASFHFIFPHHSGYDSLRYTRIGIIRLLTNCGFSEVEITPKIARDVNGLKKFLYEESKVVKYVGEIGYLVKAVKLHDI